MPWPPFTPWKDPVPIVQRAGWAPGPVSTGAKNLTSTGIQSRTVQPIASRYTNYATRPTHQWVPTGNMTMVTHIVYTLHIVPNKDLIHCLHMQHILMKYRQALLHTTLYINYCQTHFAFRSILSRSWFVDPTPHNLVRLHVIIGNCASLFRR